MNILPKKRWHVRTKENIARVRRDEAAALEKEKENQRRILLAEQEARTNLLRAKAQSSKDSENCEQLPIPVAVPNRHLNFFEDIERDGRYTGGVNKEHETEKKAEQEKYEKSIGLLNYLGQGSTESSGETPWYLKSHEARIEDEKKEKPKSSSCKDFLDPMNDMKKYLKMSFGKDDSKKKSTSDKKNQETISKKHRKRNHEGTDNDNTEIKKSSLEKLREERLKREKREREREHQLLAKVRGDVPKSKAKPIAVDERQNRYNSQFNPHLARQNQQSN